VCGGSESALTKSSLTYLLSMLDHLYSIFVMFLVFVLFWQSTPCVSSALKFSNSRYATHAIPQFSCHVWHLAEFYH